MEQAFTHYSKISIGLLFQARIVTNSPLDMVKGETVVSMTEDSSGRVRIETEANVYQQEGYHELFK